MFVTVSAENSAAAISYYTSRGYRLTASEYYGGSWFLTFAR